MPVMVTADVAGQTAEGYDAILRHLAPVMKQSPGFILHMSQPMDGGWRVIEIWETRDAANQFFAKNVHPNLPPGIRPKRSFQDLHSVVSADV